VYGRDFGVARNRQAPHKEISMQPKKLKRSRSESMIAGVCGGLGEYFGIDPTLIRLVFVLLALLGGHGVLIYLILWIVIPRQPAGASVSITDASE
jgi:phage shock protein C